MLAVSPAVPLSPVSFPSRGTGLNGFFSPCGDRNVVAIDRRLRECGVGMGRNGFRKGAKEPTVWCWGVIQVGPTGKCKVKRTREILCQSGLLPTGFYGTGKAAVEGVERGEGWRRDQEYMYTIVRDILSVDSPRTLHTHEQYKRIAIPGIICAPRAWVYCNTSFPATQTVRHTDIQA